MHRWVCRGLVALCLLLHAWPVLARTTHGMPSLKEEIEAREADKAGGKFVVRGGGCLPSPAGGVTPAAFACRAYVQGVYVDQPNATLTLDGGDGVYYLGLHPHLTSTVTGWTRVRASGAAGTGTHYLWQKAAAFPQPPSDVLLLAQLTVTSGAITDVVDLRDFDHSVDKFIRPEDFGAVGDGVTDDSGAIQQACQAAVARARAYGYTSDGQPIVLLFGAGKNYAIASEIDCQFPPIAETIELIVIAWGARFSTMHDGVTFAFNNDADCTTSDWGVAATRAQGLRWYGGTFDAVDAPTQTASVALKMYNMRKVWLWNLKIRNYYAAIEACFRDTTHIIEPFFNANLYGILVPDATVTDGALGTSSWADRIEIRGGTISAGNCVSHFALLGGRVIDLIIDNVNLSGGCTDGAIHIKDGELDDSPNNRAKNFHLRFQNLRFEQADTGDSPYIWIESRASGDGTDSVVIENSWFSMPNDVVAFTAIKLENVINASVRGNYAECPNDGLTTFLEIAKTSSNILFEGNALPSDCIPITYASLTDPLTIQNTLIRHPEIIPVTDFAKGRLTGYIGADFSTTAGVLDMTTLFLDYPADGIPPKGYFIGITCHDSGSAAGSAGNLGVRIYQDQDTADGNERHGINCNLEGVPNDKEASASGFIPANDGTDSLSGDPPADQGKLYIDISASGTDTMRVWVRIFGYVR